MQALVVAAHGSHLNPGAGEPAFAHADAIRATDAFAEVRETFWKEEPSFREVLRTLESDAVFVVPLFVSEGYFTEEVLPRELRLEGWDPADWRGDAGPVTLPATDVEQPVTYCGPVGTHEALRDVIIERAKSVTGDPDVGDGVGLAVVGHGTERNENSAATVYHHADRVRDTGRFAEVRAVFMDEEPAVDDVAADFDTSDVVVVPLFVADGYHTREDIPEDLGITDDYREGYDVPATVDDTRIWYAGAVGTEPLVAGVVLERAAAAGADVGEAAATLRERLGNPASRDGREDGR